MHAGPGNELQGGRISCAHLIAAALTLMHAAHRGSFVEPSIADLCTVFRITLPPPPPPPPEFDIPTILKPSCGSSPKTSEPDDSLQPNGPCLPSLRGSQVGVHVVHHHPAPQSEPYSQAHH